MLILDCATVHKRILHVYIQRDIISCRAIIEVIGAHSGFGVEEFIKAKIWMMMMELLFSSIVNASCLLFTLQSMYYHQEWAIDGNSKQMIIMCAENLCN